MLVGHDSSLIHEYLMTRVNAISAVRWEGPESWYTSCAICLADC